MRVDIRQARWSGRIEEIVEWRHGAHVDGDLTVGERGTLLLVFYLLVDQRDVPLVIDQPDDNLDNQTVFEILVPCIKEAKKRRQVIIVTHNPNLAGSKCPADQIIDDETAQQQLEDAREGIIAGDEEFGELAKLLSDDPGSANAGGEMDWTGPGEFVPEFEEVANAIEIGVVSEPFRSRFGWHILEVLERRTYDNTEDLKQSNCVQRVRNGKLNNETELWVRRIRDEAFVEVKI